MDAVTGITKAKSTKGPVLLRIYQGVTNTEDSNNTPEPETLLSPAQLRDHGVYIDATPQIHGGNQCIIVDNVIIPFTYVAGHCVFDNSLPTDEDLGNLSIYMI